MRNETDKQVNLERHARCCKVCAHPKREEIEQRFLAWGNVTELATFRRKIARSECALRF